MQQNLTGMDQANAVSLYENSDALDEFPVLKAFQQYIDSEQAKARKRMVSLAILFSLLMAGVIAVFVVLLLNLSQRNQSLNDRLVEFAMKERSQASQPPAAQPQSADNTSAFVSMFSRLDAMQKQIEANQQKTDKAVAEATARAVKAEADSHKKGDGVEAPSRQAEEIIRLRALLQAEKEKFLAEKEKLRQAELEVYRRKHYPEYYAVPTVAAPAKKPRKEVLRKLDSELDAELKDDDAINYFDSEDDGKPGAKVLNEVKKTTVQPKTEEIQVPVRPKEPQPEKSQPAAAEKPSPSVTAAPETKSKSAEPKHSATDERSQNEIQLNVDGRTSSWSIPND